MNRAIVIANGKIPNIKRINFLKSKGYNFIVCADGGANSARKLDLIPDVIIGDFDSVDIDTLEFYQGKSEIINLRDQNSTDIEKSLNYLIEKGFNEAVLLGATGNRLDHSLGNVHLLIKYLGKINLKLIHGKNVAKTFKGEISFKTVLGEDISIFGFSKEKIERSSGLKYPIKGLVLYPGLLESSSNQAIDENVYINSGDKVLLIIRNYKILKNYGLFLEF